MSESPPERPQPAPPPQQQPAAVATAPYPWPGPPQAPIAHPITPRTPVWPRPAGVAAPAVPLAGALAGVAAAIALPWDRPGVGWLLTGLALAASAFAIARRTAAEDSPDRARTRLVSGLWAAAALGLLGVVALRASWWLFPWCVLASAVAGSLAVAGGRSVRGLVLGAIAVPVLALGALPWAGRGIAALRRPDGGGAARIAGAVLLGAALLAVFAPLLAGADAGFARLLGDALPSVDGTRTFRSVLLFVLFGFGTIAAGYLLSAPARPDGTSDRAGRLRRIEWALPVGLLVALFGSFVGVQLANLFGGGEHVLRTTGLTYAEYARSGFWQLLMVTVLTLAVIMAVGRYAVTATPADRAWLRALLGVLAALTLVIVASALSRMWAYQQAYGFTVLRVVVSSFELWLGVVYLLVIAAGYRLRAGWLPRAVVGTGLAALLALGAGNPDQFIAEHNVQRWEQTGKIDIWYLSWLSADAVPALTRLPEPLRGCALSGIARQLDDNPDDWRRWNAGRSKAREMVTGLSRQQPECGSGIPHQR